MAALSAESLCRPEVVPGITRVQAIEKFYNESLHRPEFEAEVATPERVAHVEQLFAQARYVMVQHLIDEASRTPSPLWGEIIERVRRTQVQVSLRARAGGYLEYGPRVLTGVNGAPDVVLVPGLALLVDEQPETLMFLLLHELSHPIDPGRYAVPLSAPSLSPFASAVRCLRSAESVGAHVGDAACFAQASLRFLKFKVKPASDYCQNFANQIATNPDYSEAGPDCRCRHGQGTEAFADWNAMEALATIPDFNMRAMLAWPCATFLSDQRLEDALSAAPSGASIIESRRWGAHPEMSQRIERIILAHPAMAKLWSGPAPLHCVNSRP